jgi:hypothetical protein
MSTPVRIMQPARTPGGTVPPVGWYRYTDGQTFIRGEVLVFDGSGSVEVDSTDPTPIVGVALQGADTAPGYQAANSPTTFTYRQQKVSVALARPGEVFRSQLTNGSSTPVTPTIADVGVSYGITPYSGVWTVDKNKTSTDKRVTVVGFDDMTNDVFFTFLSDQVV